MKELDKAQLYLDIAGVMLVVIDANMEVTMINRKGCEVLGYKEDEVLGTNWFSNFLPERIRDKVSHVYKMLMAGEVEPAEYFENSVLTKSGEERIIAWHNTVLTDETGITGTLSSGEDITERKRAEEKLNESEERCSSFIQNFHGIALLTDVYFKPIFFRGLVEEITGYSEEELLNGNPGWPQIIHSFDKIKHKERIDKVCSIPGNTVEDEYRIVHKDGQTVWVHESLKNVCDVSGKPKYIQGIIYSITERKQMEDNLRFLALHDELTGLYNRRGFFNLAEHQLKLSKRNNDRTFLIYADIDGLKKINDTFGHNTGDNAIIDFANILKDTLRESDVIARIGGDEFVVYPMETSELNSKIIEERLDKNIASHNEKSNNNYKLSISVGITIYDPESSDTIDSLLSKADSLMYEKKAKKKLS